MVSKFFKGVNYRRIIIYTIVVYAILSWLFKNIILQSYIEFKMIIAILATLSFYFLRKEKKEEFLFVTILYVLLQPVLDYIIVEENINLNLLLALSAILISVSFHIDPLNKNNTGVESSQSNIDYFNLVYINSAKSYEIATLIDNTIKTTIQKENSNTESHKSSFNVRAKNGLYSGYENSNESTAGSKISESFEVKSTKSTIFRKVYAMSKDFKVENLEQGALINFDSITLNPLNAQDESVTLN